jgi:NADH-ubiquinone oxidoreductase chain 4
MASTLLGTFSDTLVGLVGSILFGLAHGFVSPGLFFIVGAVIYDRFGSRYINYYKGLTNILPLFALFFLFFVFGNMGVPLTANFIGEFLSLLGAYQQNIFIASIGALSVVISAVYSIFMYNRVTGGSISPFANIVPDVFRKEHFVILPLLLFTLILGIYPYFLSTEMELGLSNLLLFTPAIVSFSRSNRSPARN